MPADRLPLRKALQLMYAPNNLCVSKIREDIRNQISKERGNETGGPDFFSPFWSSAKKHVFGNADLYAEVNEHIAVLPRRRQLYLDLRDGFLLWWNQRRRWTNEPFVPAQSLATVYEHAPLGVSLAINNILSVRDGTGEDHFIYPYFCRVPVLCPEAARIGLWVMGRAFESVAPEELRILDVIRGENFSLQRCPLQGDEASIFEERFGRLQAEWVRLRSMYD